MYNKKKLSDVIANYKKVIEANKELKKKPKS